MLTPIVLLALIISLHLLVGSTLLRIWIPFTSESFAEINADRGRIWMLETERFMELHWLQGSVQSELYLFISSREEREDNIYCIQWILRLIGQRGSHGTARNNPVVQVLLVQKAICSALFRESEQNVWCWRASPSARSNRTFCPIQGYYHTSQTFLKLFTEIDMIHSRGFRPHRPKHRLFLILKNPIEPAQAEYPSIFNGLRDDVCSFYAHWGLFHPF
jgi:hypothetical protein